MFAQQQRRHQQAGSARAGLRRHRRRAAETRRRGARGRWTVGGDAAVAGARAPVHSEDAATSADDGRDGRAGTRRRTVLAVGCGLASRLLDHTEPLSVSLACACSSTEACTRSLERAVREDTRAAVRRPIKTMHKAQQRSLLQLCIHVCSPRFPVFALHCSLAQCLLALCSQTRPIALRLRLPLRELRRASLPAPMSIAQPSPVHQPCTIHLCIYLCPHFFGYQTSRKQLIARIAPGWGQRALAASILIG